MASVNERAMTAEAEQDDGAGGVRPPGSGGVARRRDGRPGRLALEEAAVLLAELLDAARANAVGELEPEAPP